MDMPYIVVILALGTMLAALIYALIGKKQIENRMDDPDSTKSKLAADKASADKPADV